MSRKTIFLVFTLIFFYSVTSFAQGLDNAFDNAMKFGVFPRRPHFDAFWNPAKAAASQEKQVGFFHLNFPYQYFDVSLSGIGATYGHRANTFIYFSDHLKINFHNLKTVPDISLPIMNYDLDEKAYRLGYAHRFGRKIQTGLAFERIDGTENIQGIFPFAGLIQQSNSFRQDGLDLSFYAAMSPSIQLEYLFLDASTHIEERNNKQRVPSTHVVQMDFFPLKGLALSAQAVFYKDDTLDDQDDFKSGASYTFKNMFSARVIAGEAGRFSLYGASVHVKNISLNYDRWRYDIVGDDTQSFLSAVLTF